MTPSPDTERLYAIVRVVISLVVLAVALGVIVSQQFPDDYSKWAFGMVGLVLGYWLR